MLLKNMRADFADKYGKGSAMLGDGGDWLFHCCNVNTSACPNQRETIRTIWRKSETFNDFLANVKSCDDLKYTSQAYAELGKHHFWPIPVAKTARRITTISDAGSVKVGDVAGTMSYLIPNGCGDGTTQVAICNTGEINTDMMHDAGVINGTFGIYSYDCAENMQFDSPTLDGKFFVYYASGLVAFVRQ